MGLPAELAVLLSKKAGVMSQVKNAPCRVPKRSGQEPPRGLWGLFAARSEASETQAPSECPSLLKFATEAFASAKMIATWFYFHIFIHCSWRGRCRRKSC